MTDEAERAEAGPLHITFCSRCVSHGVIDQHPHGVERRVSYCNRVVAHLGNGFQRGDEPLRLDDEFARTGSELRGAPRDQRFADLKENMTQTAAEQLLIAVTGPIFG